MHISEGVLSGPVLLAGAALAAAGTGIGLKKLEPEQIPRAAMLAGAFFVASLVHVPLGPTSVHLVLNGLVGLLLGWTAFPAILVGLVLQAVFFQFGGLTTLGVNTLIMALPAVTGYGLFSRFLQGPKAAALAAAFACGFLSVLLGGVVVGLALALSGEHFLNVAFAVVLAHLPVMGIEGVVTALCVGFLRRVQPGLLPGRPPVEVR
ncbi:MAG: cobalt transporter CbiM [Desulfobacterales bacterium]